MLSQAAFRHMGSCGGGHLQSNMQVHIDVDGSDFQDHSDSTVRQFPIHI